MLVFSHLAAGQSSGSYLITTVAGLGSSPGNGDGGPALYASLITSAIAVDNSGNIYIADTWHYTVRIISPEGIISTVAGNGTRGFSGDGGPATAAQLNWGSWGLPTQIPNGVAVDKWGNLFIADTGNNRIRKVSQGIITTVAEGVDTPTGVAVDQSGNLIITTVNNNLVLRVNTTTGAITTVAGGESGVFGGDGGPATAAGLGLPCAVAIDSSGNVFIADWADQRIRMVSAATGIITTVAGNGTAGFSGDGGPATSASLQFPSGVAVDRAGNLIIDDVGNFRIRMVNASTGIITTVAGGGPDTGNGAGDGGPANLAQLGACGDALNCGTLPLGVATDLSDNILIGGGDGAVRGLVLAPTSTAGCTYSLDQSGGAFQAAGGSNTVGVLTSASTCPWFAVSWASWATVTSPTGITTGLGLFTYDVSANSKSATRNGTIWIGGRNLGVSQSGVPCTLSVSPLNVSVAARGETGATFSVTTSASDCQWGVAAWVPWILLDSGSTGIGGGSVTFTVGINTGAQRSGTITVTGQQGGSATITITQFAVTDFEGTGGTTVADVQLIINESLGTGSPNNDVNFDGVVNVADVQVVIDAALCISNCPVLLSSELLTYTNVTRSTTQNLTVSASSVTQFTLNSAETSCTSSNWLQVVNGGYTASSTAFEIPVTVSPTGITNGTTCSGTISLVTTNGATETVKVTMTVGSPPSGNSNTTITISATLTSLGTSYVASGPATLTGDISDVGTFSANLDLTTIASGGSTPYTLTLMNGTMAGQITIAHGRSRQCWGVPHPRLVFRPLSRVGPGPIPVTLGPSPRLLVREPLAPPAQLC